MIVLAAVLPMGAAFPATVLIMELLFLRCIHVGFSLPSVALNSFLWFFVCELPGAMFVAGLLTVATRMAVVVFFAMMNDNPILELLRVGFLSKFFTMTSMMRSPLAGTFVAMMIGKPGFDFRFLARFCVQFYLAFFSSYFIAFCAIFSFFYHFMSSLFWFLNFGVNICV